jgi:hypothetical protein
VERIETLKANDPHRQRIAELFQTWWEHHGATPLKVNQLAEPVKVVADPQGRGRQYLATFIAGLADTHAAGFLLSRQESAGKWTAATYALTKALSKDPIGHRTDQMDGVGGMARQVPIGPMGPMPNAIEDADVREPASCFLSNTVSLGGLRTKNSSVEIAIFITGYGGDRFR